MIDPRYHRECSKYDPFFKGEHHWEVLGKPHSKMTYYVCQKCHLQIERGQGAFYRDSTEQDVLHPSAHEAESNEQNTSSPTPQADEVKRLGDTARLDYMIDAGAIVSKFNTLEHGLTYRVEWPFKQQVQIEHYKTPREAIDAALSHKEEADGTR